MNPIASIIVPVHNGARFVRTAIASALAQTCRETEIIVVDDGSTDNTWDVVGECANQDSRVVPLRRAVRGRPAAARNFALAHATGRWIALLDADDAFLPDRLSELIARAETLNADLLADNLILRDFQTGAALGNAYSEDGFPSEPLALTDILMRDMPGSRIYYDRFGYVKPIMRSAFGRESSPYPRPWAGAVPALSNNHAPPDRVRNAAEHLAALRSQCLSLANSCSIGFRSVSIWAGRTTWRSPSG